MRSPETHQHEGSTYNSVLDIGCVQGISVGMHYPYAWQEEQPDEPAVVGVVLELLAAGYRPAVWRHVAPPGFLHRGRNVLDVFDPFDFHSPEVGER